MGFIPSSSTRTLYAYLTQTGRYNLLFGDSAASKVAKFTLHDNDINYDIASNIINFNYNKLARGFVPDITGDNDDCIRSVAQAYIVDENSYLIWGGVPPSTPPPPTPTPPGSGPPPPAIPYPIADFSASTNSGLVPLTVAFTDMSVNMATDYNPLTWEWDFQNDGTVDSTDQNPTFTYNTPGIYEVSLKASNFYGINIKTKTSYINVTAPVLRKMRIEFDYPTNLINGDSSWDTASDWLHRQTVTSTPPAYNSRTNWVFGSKVINQGLNGGSKDPRFYIRLKVDPSEADQTSPITQAEKESATFTIKLEQPFTDFNYITTIQSTTCYFNSIGDTCSLSFGTIPNPLQNILTFYINQTWINQNYTTINNNPVVNINQIIQQPFNIDFNFKIESNSPNVVIPPDKNTYNYAARFQAFRTA